MKTLRKLYESTGYLMDPHTAVAKSVAENFIHINRPMIITATAHYSKFGVDVLRGLYGECTPEDTFKKLRSVGARPSMHHVLESATSRPCVHDRVSQATVEAVMKETVDFLEHFNTLERK